MNECMDLQTLQKPMTQDDISSHTLTIESDEFIEHKPHLMTVLDL